jgi:hypothetical protein
MFIKRKEIGSPLDFAELNDEELKAAIAERTKETGGTRPRVRRVRETVGATETRGHALDVSPAALHRTLLLCLLPTSISTVWLGA